MHIVDALICLIVFFYLFFMDSYDLSWSRHQMEKKSALLALCEENQPATDGFPSQRPVTRSFDVFGINGWTNNRDAGDLRRQRTHYDVTLINVFYILQGCFTGATGSRIKNTGKSCEEYRWNRSLHWIKSTQALWRGVAPVELHGLI